MIVDLFRNQIIMPRIELGHRKCLVRFLSPAVRIGFVETEFTVAESESGVTQELALLEGTISRELGNIIVTLFTNDRTASGQ